MPVRFAARQQRANDRDRLRDTRTCSTTRFPASPRSSPPPLGRPVCPPRHSTLPFQDVFGDSLGGRLLPHITLIEKASGEALFPKARKARVILPGPCICVELEGVGGIFSLPSSKNGEANKIPGSLRGKSRGNTDSWESCLLSIPKDNAV